MTADDTPDMLYTGCQVVSPSAMDIPTVMHRAWASCHGQGSRRHHRHTPHPRGACNDRATAAGRVSVHTGHGSPQGCGAYHHPQPVAVAPTSRPPATSITWRVSGGICAVMYPPKIKQASGDRWACTHDAASWRSWRVRPGLQVTCRSTRDAPQGGPAPHPPNRRRQRPDDGPLRPTGRPWRRDARGR